MSRPVRINGGFGGGGGSAWDDFFSHKPMIVGVQSIDIRSSNQVDSIQVTYLCADKKLYKAPRHGSSGRPQESIHLENDERIVRVEGQTNDVQITQLTFYSKRQDGTEMKYGPFGETGRTSFAVEGYILGFNGRASNHLDGLGIYYLSPLVKSKCTAGGSGGRLFDDRADAMIPPVVGIRKMVIRSGNEISSIKSTFLQLGGTTVEGSVNGGSGGSESTLQWTDAEVITGMEVLTNGEIVNQITLHSTHQGTHGPFGKPGPKALKLDGNILGFYGTAGNFMESVGTYHVQN